jgi:beta-lysine 5,6-aminomutase alpha subunit
LLREVDRDSIWEAVAKGAFADVKRKRDGGKGFAGVVAKAPTYLNPFVDALEKGG